VGELLPEVKFQGKLAIALRGGRLSKLAPLKEAERGLGSGAASLPEIK
jgi:hypothetical protein